MRAANPTDRSIQQHTRRSALEQERANSRRYFELMKVRGSNRQSVCLLDDGGYKDLTSFQIIVFNQSINQSKEARARGDFTTEHLLMSFFIPEQLEEEKAVEEIYNNALLVTNRGPELYIELDNMMQQKPH